MSGEINEEESTKNLMVLRTKLRLKQSELTERVGSSRQVFSEIEKGKRMLQCNVFVALLFVFHEGSSTNDLLLHHGIYTPELGRYLISSQSSGNE